MVNEKQLKFRSILIILFQYKTDVCMQISETYYKLPVLFQYFLLC